MDGITRTYPVNVPKPVLLGPDGVPIASKPVPIGVQLVTLTCYECKERMLHAVRLSDGTTHCTKGHKGRVHVEVQ